VDGGWRVVDCATDHCYRKAAAKLSAGHGSYRLLDHEPERLRGVINICHCERSRELALSLVEWESLTIALDR
jgi:hypothetical protein